MQLQLRRRDMTEIGGADARSKAQIEAESRARNFRHRAQSLKPKTDGSVRISPAKLNGAVRPATNTNSESESKLTGEHKADEVRQLIQESDSSMFKV
jgi:hypothetical protein